MNRRTVWMVLALSLLLLACGQPAATPASQGAPSLTDLERIQRVENGLIPVTPDGWFDFANPQSLAERMEHYGVPGVGIAVIDDGRLAWAKGYGLLEVGGDAPVTADSLFHAGSIAKPVSAAVIMTNSASGEGAIRFEILLSIAEAYGWPLTLLPVDLIDLAVVVVANLYNLLMAAIFFTRPRGWERFERITGLILVALALPLTAAAVLNLLANRAWWFVVLPIPLILHCLVELLLDYILKVDFRRTRLLGPYLALFYLGQWGLIGYAFVAEPVYGFVTLATYFLCLGATGYAHAKGVG